jgi:3-oxoacyl-[acyl-carrier-protein] synthase-1
MVFVNQMTLTSALGAGLEATRNHLESGRSGLREADWPDCDVPCYLGVVDIPDHISVPPERLSRNNRLIEYALQQDDFAEHVRLVTDRYGSSRIGVVMGTSTSSIDRTEAAYRAMPASDHFAEEFLQPRTHNPHAPGDYLAARLGLTGPCMTVSAACASSAKVFAAAKRWLEQELVDAVVVGGADSLCLSVIYGFHSLQLVSDEPCRPFSPDRKGISLGEAAGFALLTREPEQIRVSGVGESCDAYHMSSAHPEGLGAKLSMERALAAAGLSLADVDYVNLHGTGTRANDETEGKVCAAAASPNTLFSATKGWTGHALGAAGIVESILSINALLTGFVPGTINTRCAEPGLAVLLESVSQPINTAMTNSFGFGGNNCSVVFARA